ncbi:MAG: hypothetical protein AB7P40_16105 [Chloroflexota bacterium]
MTRFGWLARMLAVPPPDPCPAQRRAELRDEQVEAVLHGVQDLKKALSDFEAAMDRAGVRPTAGAR